MKLTILLYHKIDEPPAGVRTPANFVSPARFAEQLDALQAWGYTTITFDLWLDHLNGLKVPVPPKPVILTFDDGYACFDRHAWPELRARGMGATVFLVAGQIGGANLWDRDEVRMPLLDAGRIRALRDEGVHFGSHGISHQALTQLSRDDAFQELARSRWALAELLDREIDVFAYPFTHQNSEIRALTRQAGYRCAVRGQGRLNTGRGDPFALRRIPVISETTPASLRRTLFRERYFRPL